MRRETTAALLVSLLLIGVPAAGDAPGSMAPRHPGSTRGDEPADGRLTMGVGVALGVSQLFEVDGVNQRLTSGGFTELPAVGAHVTFAAPLFIDRVVLRPQLRLARFGAPGDGAELDTYLGTFSFGYSLTPPEPLAVYPFAGLGVGAAELSLGTPGPTGGSFDEALRRARGSLDLSTIGFVGTVGVAVDWLLARASHHPTRGLFVGLRAGYSAVFVSSAWSFGPEQGDVTDGPLAPLSGYYGEGALGLRF